MPTGYTLTAETIKRIAQAVRAIEAQQGLGSESAKNLSTGGLTRVSVRKTGGNDGSTTTAATWTYECKRGDTVLATNVAYYRPRPIGPMTPAPNDSVAWAFNDAGTLKLWAVGEVQPVETCAASFTDAGDSEFFSLQGL